jgi:cytoskeletal protein CcmA (bactofilin family)
MEKAEKKPGTEEAPLVSVINCDIVIEGNLTATQGVQMEGRIVGDVRCSALVVGEKGSIQGTIRADRVRVLGEVEGGVETKDLAVEQTGRVKGDIQYDRLKIASGAVVQGNLQCTAPDQRTGEANRLKLVEPPSPPEDGKDAGHVYIE